MSDKTPIFKWIWDVCPAKNGDKLVLLCLACFADPKKDGECWAAPEMLEAKTGMTRRNIYRCMQRLVANGWLILGAERKVEHGRTLCRRYRIPYSSDNLSDLSSDNLSSSSDNLSVSSDNLSSSSDKLYTDKEHKEHKEEKNTPPTASQPSSSPLSFVGPPFPEPPKSVSPPKPKKKPKLEVAESDLVLPHGEGFRRAWLQFMEHRRHPIRGRRVPLTKQAAELVLKDMSKINEQQACEAIGMAIKTAWIVPYIDKYVQEPIKVAAFVPRTGPIQPSEAERRMLALEALQADRMKGAA